MKATELMINDWGLYEGEPYQIRELGTYGVNRDGEDYPAVCIGKPTGIGLIVERKKIKPIPLTHEILEKNGWVYNNDDEKFFPQTWVGGGLMLQGTDDCGYRIVVTSDYDDEDTNNTPFILLFVHELQHALRLRRIKKEIKL